MDAAVPGMWHVIMYMLCRHVIPGPLHVSTHRTDHDVSIYLSIYLYTVDHLDPELSLRDVAWDLFVECPSNSGDMG